MPKNQTPKKSPQAKSKWQQLRNKVARPVRCLRNKVPPFKNVKQVVLEQAGKYIYIPRGEVWGPAEKKRFAAQIALLTYEAVRQAAFMKSTYNEYYCYNPQEPISENLRINNPFAVKTALRRKN